MAAPIRDAALRDRLLSMFDTLLRDNVQARRMQPDGVYRRLEPGEDAPLNAQEAFYQQAYDQAAAR